MESRRFIYRRVVVEDDIDDFGHANNLRMLSWTLEAEGTSEGGSFRSCRNQGTEYASRGAAGDRVGESSGDT